MEEREAEEKWIDAALEDTNGPHVVCIRRVSWALLVGGV